MKRRNILITFFLALAFTVGSASEAKETYPSEKITLVVPYKAGGGYDIYLRALSPYLTRYLKEVSPGAKGGEIMIKNEYASAGRKGYMMTFNAKPDGYTLGAVGSGSLIEGIIEQKVEFDFTKLTFLVLANASRKAIITRKDGFNSWKEVLQALQKGPVKMAAGSFGRTNHSCSIITNEVLGTKIKLINFPGTAESLNALVRGDVQLAFVDEEPIQGLLASKEVKVLLLFDTESEYPGSVTITELGHPELAENFTDMRFIVGPPKLDEEAKNILLAALKKAQNDRDFVNWAKNHKYRLVNLFGKEAQTALINFIDFYEKWRPALKKYRE